MTIITPARCLRHTLQHRDDHHKIGRSSECPLQHGGDHDNAGPRLRAPIAGRPLQHVGDHHNTGPRFGLPITPRRRSSQHRPMAPKAHLSTTATITTPARGSGRPFKHDGNHHNTGRGSGRPLQHGSDHTTPARGSEPPLQHSGHHRHAALDAICSMMATFTTPAAAPSAHCSTEDNTGLRRRRPIAAW